MGMSSTMRQGPSPLIQVVALCQMLVEALGQLDHEIASEALMADLRDLCKRASAVLAGEDVGT
jgi:hypothetical protein